MVRYNQLDTQKSEIRLVTLLPGKPRDAIRCTLSTASLHDKPAFTALSYVWGDPCVTKPITVEGEPFDVTVNLEAGLRVIRRRGRRLVLWIDAICINQNDVQEKNAQVPHMGRLYSTAPAVLAWLGPSNSNIELFVSWMRAHAKKSHIAASAYWLWLDARSAHSTRARLERDWAMVQAYEGYHDLLALPYWGRVWTFQEYVLPRTEPMCLCGNIQPFQLSTVIGKFDLDDLIKLNGQAMDRLGVEYMDINGERSTMLAEVYRRQKTKGRSTLYSRVWALARLRHGLEGLLATMLFFTTDRQCFDERDKIYALHGMVPAAQDLYPPDYTKPINDVMLQAAAYIVNVERFSKILLQGFGLRHERLLDSRLYPSWMPDFSSDQSSLSVHVMEGGVAMPLKRCHNTYRPAFVSVESATLRIGARYLGTCKVAVQFADTTSSIFEQIHVLFQMDVLEYKMGKAVRKPETLISRIARACVAHQSDLSDHSTKEILETFYLIFHSDPNALPDSSHEPCWYRILSAVDCLIGKALLVTEDGYFGISVGGAKDGDILVVPPEVRVPLVLTLESSTSADGIEYYNMVGTAIVDGVMREGVLFDEELVEEIAKRDVVEFLVR